MKLTKEEKELLGRILNYVKPFNPISVQAVYISPSQRLRNEADEMDLREQDVEDFQDLINNKLLIS